ncbi:hypothetical protein SFRURICE_000881 [Spodoptera frugiperda]|nr:hypothetical protein SFRURICE_000881 [Spodoptera frugiperda]
MFRRRISMHGQFPLHKQEISYSGHRACHVVGPPCQYNAWEPRHWISRAVQLHGMHNDQNLTPVDFYMKALVYTDGIGRVSKFFSETYLKIMTK